MLHTRFVPAEALPVSRLNVGSIGRKSHSRSQAQ